MKRILILGALAGGLVFADAHAGLRPPAEGHDPATAPPTYASAERSSDRSSADTLRYSVAAGRALIASLPERIGDRPVRAYVPLRVPTLSALAGHSFFWRTRPQDAGQHRLLFEAAFEDTAPPDTLVVQVEVSRDGPR